jgi:hypothetical protein
MKRIALLVLTVFLMISGVIMAQQSEDENKGSSMPGMMQPMMKQKQNDESRAEGMGRMMGMMKMMEQCSAMMKSAHGSQGAKESRQK